MGFARKALVLCGALIVCMPTAGAGTLYVDDDAPLGGNGGSWETAFAFLPDALTAAVSGDEIRVAQGTYYPDRNAANPTGTGARTASFTLKNGVGVVGGYAGQGTPEPNERNIALYGTILSGDIGTLGDNSDNSYHVVHSGSTGATALLDGFTITAGNANGSTDNSRGGGVYCSSSSPTLANCMVVGNTASINGGGVYCDGASPTLTNCVVTSNSANYAGGGVYCQWPSAPTLTNCTLVGNTANSRGGGVYCYGSSNPILTNCVLWASTPQAIYVQSGSPVVTYCDVQGGWSGAGNIDADPGFAFGGDFHLLTSSPCIDAGTANPPGGLPPDDLEGQTRALDGDGDGSTVVDMGAYEFNPATPTLAISATELTITAVLGQTGSQSFGIRNASLGALAWNVESAPDWLTADPPTGESTGEVDTVTLTADTANLAHGIYTTTMSINADDAFNAPRAVTVVLRVPAALQVPSQYPTIQAAIDAATMPEDEVVIADGVYTGAGNKDLDFHGRAVPVRSASGNPATCVIDCEGVGRGFYFHSGETAGSIVNGLTIRNASDSGVYCYISSPTLTNCTLIGNSGDYGGGLHCYASSPTLTGCVLTGNSAIHDGGGVYCEQSNPTLTRCTSTGNSATGGGGVYCEYHSNPTLDNCGISGNMANSSAGGGLCCQDFSSPTLTNCTIADNGASSNGGGVYCDTYSSPALVNGVIMGNTAGGYGGGVHCSDFSSPTLKSCVITGNAASSGAGGGICCHLSDPTLTNCTITGNSAIHDGGGVYCEQSDPTLTNCILWTNLPEAIQVQSGTLVATCCDVQGGWNGAGNIAADPGFAFPNDYHLLGTSPCVDAGTNDPPGGLPPDDLDGQARPLDGDGNGAAAADMGAYEFNLATPTLALSATKMTITAQLGQAGSQTLGIRNSSLGTLAWEVESTADWLTAAPATGESTGEVDTITLTANAANLAHGTYVTTLWVNADEALNTPRAITVLLRVSLALHVPSEYPTIQAAIDATTFPGDEVVIADGVYTGVGNKELDFHGQAITVRSANGDPVSCIIDCEGNGRGFYFHSGESAASVVQGLTVRNGNASAGGGVYCEHSSPTLNNCMIADNTATSSGGGVYCYDSSNPTLTTCMIVGNAGGNGGGVYCSSSDPTLTNCTIRANAATTNGGGVYCCNSSSPTLTNCIVWYDTPRAIFVSSSSPVVTYCDVQGGWSGTGNIDADPGFAFPSDPHLLSSSPCVDAGTNNPAGGLPPDDLEGQPRPLDGDGDGAPVVDMGAHELNPTAPTLAVSAAELVITARLGQTGSATLDIRNASLGALDWEVGCGADWLTAGPAAGESSGEVDTVTLTADTAGLTHGMYIATVWVNADQAFNAPRAVSVVLYVTLALDVPGEYPTIQAAIDATTMPGDEVVIADGVYTGAGNKDLDFGGRAITVRSASGAPTACVIDCEGSGRGFHFHSGEDASSIIQGLTIRNGHVAGSGGAVYCESYSGPTLANCIITGSTADNYGGGVCGYNFSSPNLTNCTISGDQAGSGGGVYWGGSSSPTLVNCTITGNEAGDRGGGMHCYSASNPMLTNCTIAGNTAGRGGGLCCELDASPTLANCTVAGNTAVCAGGIYCNTFATPKLTNCAILRNSASNGGGVYCTLHSNMTLVNCTVTGNTASNDGGGVHCSDYSSPMLTNCILWANTPQAIFAESVSPFVTYCDVQGGWAGAGNIDTDPGFAFPNDPHLLGSSPCIDAGTNNPGDGLPPGDSEGQPRPLDGNGDGTAVADMGAHEFNPAAPTLAVSATEVVISAWLGQAGSQTLGIRNSSLGTLAWELASAVDWLTVDPPAGESAGEIDAVTLTADTAGLAHGTYVTTVWVNAAQAFNSPREVTVVLHAKWALHVPSEHPTIQAAIAAADVPGDEVIIADGVYTGAGNKDLDFQGRAITVRSASGDPAACIIDCEGRGRGFYFHGGESTAAKVHGVTVRNGNAGDGGGVYCASYSSPTLANCIITGNTANIGGGGVACWGAYPILTNCSIAGNTAGVGGGVYSWCSNPTLANCTILGNAATDDGGGVCCCQDSDPRLINCTLTANTTSGNGGGVICYDTSSPMLTNCILWANTPQALYVDSGSPLVTWCDVQGGYGGTGNFSADPLFGRSPNPGPDDQWGTPDDFFGDLHLTHGSICIDAGSNAAVPTYITADMGGAPRFVDVACRPDTGSGTPPIVDLGAYEAPGDVLIDCNANAVDDVCDIVSGTSADCNANGAPDECDIADGTSADANANGIPDECEASCDGDLDCSGAIDFVDINAFVLYLSNQPVWQTTYAGCNAANGDIDGNGVYPAFADINAFVTLLSTHSLPLPCGGH